GRLHNWQVSGLGIWEEAAGISAHLTPRIHNVGSIAHQPTGFDKVPCGIRRWEPMACREMNQLDTPAIEEGVDTDQKSIGPFTRKRCESFVDLADCAGVDDLNLQPDSASCGFQVSQRRVDNRWMSGLTSTATRLAAGTSSRRSSNRFAVNSPVKKLTPVRLPPGRARLATRPSLTGSSATTK